MKHNSEDFSINASALEKWLEDFFLNPLTSYLDESTFHIDLFETDGEIIVEVILTEYKPSNVSVYLSEEKLIIKAYPKNRKNSACPKIRTLSFPFHITQKKVYAKFEKGILEIFISKYISGPGKNRYVTLPS